MLPAQLSQAQRNTLYSPLPNLRTDVNFATKHPSNSRFVLDKRQMLKWPDFEKEMRSYLTKHVGNIASGRNVLLTKLDKGNLHATWTTITAGTASSRHTTTRGS
ncbi:hypothetical protein APSETT444_007903 [Aspergillus pseudonomiae]